MPSTSRAESTRASGPAESASALTWMQHSTAANLSLDSEESCEYDSVYKILIIGDANVGKTSFLERAANKAYIPNLLPTIGVDFKTSIIGVAGKRVKLQIWDTSGQERYRAMTTPYYRGAAGVFLAYDITSTKSFQNVRSWLKTLERHTDEKIVRVLLGMKQDLESWREVSTDEGAQLAAQFGMPFLETSSAMEVNVEEALEIIAKNLTDTASSIVEPSLPALPPARTSWIRALCSIL